MSPYPYPPTPSGISRISFFSPPCLFHAEHGNRSFQPRGTPKNETRDPRWFSPGGTPHPNLRSLPLLLPRLPPNSRDLPVAGCPFFFPGRNLEILAFPFFSEFPFPRQHQPSGHHRVGLFRSVLCFVFFDSLQEQHSGVSRKHRVPADLRSWIKLDKPFTRVRGRLFSCSGTERPP